MTCRDRVTIVDNRRSADLVGIVIAGTLNVDEAPNVDESASRGSPMANCPKCNKPFFMLNAQALKTQVQFGHELSSLAYTCPSCHAVLSVGIDPVRLKAEIVSELFQRLKKDS